MRGSGAVEGGDDLLFHALQGFGITKWGEYDLLDTGVGEIVEALVRAKMVGKTTFLGFSGDNEAGNDFPRYRTLTQPKLTASIRRTASAPRGGSYGWSQETRPSSVGEEV